MAVANSTTPYLLDYVSLRWNNTSVAAEEVTGERARVVGLALYS
jgi:hypothetical protein